MENNQTNLNQNNSKTTTHHARKKQNKPKHTFLKLIRNIIIVIILLNFSLFVLEKAPNYKEPDTANKTNLIINNNNITAFLKKDILIDNDYIYLSKQDIANFFDPYIYFNEDEKRIIITYDTKVTNMFLDNTSITINDETATIAKAAYEKDDIIYIPFSELSESFNMDLNYNKDTNIITVDTLSKEQIKATATKNLSVKSMKDTFSRTVDKVKKNEEVIVIEKDNEKELTKIRTADGFIGYVKSDKLTNETLVRTAVVEKLQVDGKINMVWDAFYSTAPDRTGSKIDGLNVISPTCFTMKNSDGEITDRFSDGGTEYVAWAKSNNYKVWGLVANDEINIDETSEILNSYENRNTTINNILELADKYDLDGINIDFENMYKTDKDVFTQFIVELFPRLKEKNLVLSVDVTAPDGADTWSMCFDRHDIANNCHYIVFMAYDQYGASSNKAGTTAGLDWIKVNLNKFLKTEEIDPSQIILGLPFYTRLWTVNSDETATSDVVDMNNVKRALPTNAYNNKEWDEDLAQYYVEYTQYGKTKKIWIEDERSLKEKLNLITKHDLAGAAFWAKDRESDSIWEVIKEALD